MVKLARQEQFPKTHVVGPGDIVAIVTRGEMQAIASSLAHAQPDTTEFSSGVVSKTSDNSVTVSFNDSPPESLLAAVSLNVVKLTNSVRSLILFFGV